MNKPPRDPRDPFDDPFFNNNDKGGFDPFNDPFFKHIEQIQRSIFGDFFGDDNVTIFSIEGPNASHDSDNNNNNNDAAPDLSAINPDVPSSSTNNPRNRHQERNSAPGFLHLFEHFMQPEYDEHKLSDVNPNLDSDAPIMEDDRDNQGLVHPPHGPSPGFRSPYLPNWTGAEKEMHFEQATPGHGGPNTFYRSQSVTITTGPDGKTRKTTTIRDSSGHEQTSTEEFDANDDAHGHGGQSSSSMPRIFYWNDRNRSDGSDDNGASNDEHRFGFMNAQSPLFEQTHDPFARLRHKWQHWRYNPFNWYKQQQRVYGGETHGSDDDNGSDWMWSQRQSSQEKKRTPSSQSSSPSSEEQSGIRWRSYRDYQSEQNEKRPSLLDDIIKKD